MPLPLWVFAFVALACDASDPSADAGGIDDAASDAAPGPSDAARPDSGSADTGSGGEPYPNVARVTLPPSFTRNPDGTYGIDDGSELFDVGQAFYTEHADDYDMLIVWTDAPVAEMFAFSVPLDHAIDGIGLQEVMARYGWGDYTPALAGSEGRLEHVALMNDRSTYVGARFTAQEILTHEVGHRWSANLFLPGATDPEVLVDRFWSHWTIFADVGGPSALGYGELEDHGDGSFTYRVVRPLRYSRLELYQQGLIGPSEVGELFYVEGAADFDPPMPGGPDQDAILHESTFTGTRVDFDVEDVIDAYGPRVPSHESAPREHRMAFVLACDRAEACPLEALEWVDAQRIRWETTFSDATGGRASVRTEL